MAALLTEADLAQAAAPGPATGQVAAQAASEAEKYSSTGDMIKGRMPELVKGAGFAFKGGNKPLDDHTDILTRASQASLDLRGETYRGFRNKSSVVKSLNQGWLDGFGALKTALTMPSIGEEISKLVSLLPGGPDALKSFTAGNLGIGSVYGLTPFNLLAPSRLG